MNRYKIKFNSQCPNNKDVIEYSLTIESNQFIEIEKIKDYLLQFDFSFQERIADLLHKKFGGRQFISAIHDGVLIETYRGFHEIPKI